MVELTLNSAKEFNKECLNNIEDVSFRESIKNHSIAVGEMAVILAQGKFDEETFLIAGLLHDIGISIEKENHAMHSLFLLKKANYNISPILEDCILNHGFSKTPTTKEGKIFQLADKVSIFNQDSVRLWLNKHGEFNQDTITYLKKTINKIDQILK